MKNPELGTEKEQKLPGESRFGDKNEVSRWLKEGTVEEKTEIENIIPKLKGRHSNVVEVAVLPQHHRVLQEKIRSQFVEEKKGKIYIRGVFKPFVGELASKKSEFGFDFKTHCHKREEMAYLMDLELGFDIVPPTVEKEIDKQVGSIQLFIPPREADWEQDVVNLDKEKLHKSDDYFKVALFDYIIQNPDRKDENYLVSLDGSKCFAVDHGYVLPPRGLQKKDILGKPRKTLRGQTIPDSLLKKLKDFAAREKEISDRLEQSVVDVSGIFQRVKELIRSEKVL